MPLLLSLLGNKWTYIVLALISALGWGQIQTWRLHSSQKDLQAITAAFEVFKAQVQVEGQKAKERADLQAKQDLQRQKEADNEAKKRYASLDAQYAQYRMRQRAGNSATSSLLPSASTDPGSSSKVCYSRDSTDSEITGSIRRLRIGIAEDSEPYDKAVVVAMLCKTWAVGR